MNDFLLTYLAQLSLYSARFRLQREMSNQLAVAPIAMVARSHFQSDTAFYLILDITQI